jgi:hypothetical protein
MSVIKNIIAGLILVSFAWNVSAAEADAAKPKAKLRGPAEFQKVIDDYKAYVAKIPPEIRDEVIEFRKSVAKLNKQKKLIYRQLSQASQNYLKKEQQYKKKLPLNRKSLINIEDPGKKVQKVKTQK